jgi:hypothetical protein
LIAAPAVTDPSVEGADVAQSICSVEHCEKVVHGQGYCSTHYRRWRTGTLDQMARLQPDGSWARDCRTCGTEVLGGVRGPVYCPPCRRVSANEKQKNFRARNLDRLREKDREFGRRRNQDPVFKAKKRVYILRKTYGMSIADYDALLHKQGGRCAICRGSHVGHGEHLHVDHDHSTGAIRGLLCAKCNTMLGLSGDSPEVLRAAIDYLRGTDGLQELPSGRDQVD